MIELRHLQKAYPNSMPLKDVNAIINKGDVISIIGSSGCGKSTLLRCINMLDPPTGGQIIVEGEDITSPGYDLNRLRMKIGMIFQNFNLFQHQSVIENIMQPQMKLLKRSKQEAYDKAYAFLLSMGLAKQQFQFPSQLSGGQQQRVAIARALAMDPKILLLDEPTSALDPTMVGEVEAVLYDLAKRETTMMLVTHDMDLARSISSRVFYLDEGGVYEDGPPKQIFLNPQRENTRRFIRSLSSLDIKVESAVFDYPKAIADIERFCNRQELDSRTIYKLQMAFEELCAIYLPGQCKGIFCAHASFEYFKQTSTVHLSIKHNSGIISQEKLRSELPLMIVSRVAAGVRQLPLEETAAPYTSQIELTFQKGADDIREK